MDNKCCVVTGGAGFIGCAISPYLVEQFDSVVAVDNLHPQVHRKRERPLALDRKVELIEADVTESAIWDRLAGLRPNVVIHLAAETGTGQSLTEATRHGYVNVVGTTQMLDGLARNSVFPERMVLTSSRAVYGEGAWINQSGERTYPGQRNASMLERGEWDFPGLRSLPFDAEQTFPKPTSIYGATKLAQEHLMESWARAFSVQLNILRLQNVYGPGQSLTNPYTGIVSLFARLAKAGKSIPLYEDGEMKRDFVYISDVAKAVLISATGEASGILADIGTGQSISIREVASIISAIYGAPSPHVTGQFRNGDVRHAACVIDSATRLLKWMPEVQAKDGIKMLCDWIDSQPPGAFD